MVLGWFAIYPNRALELAEVIESSCQTVIGIFKFVRRKEFAFRDNVVSDVVGPVIPEGRANAGYRVTRRHGIGEAHQHLEHRRGGVLTRSGCSIDATSESSVGTMMKCVP